MFLDPTSLNLESLFLPNFLRRKSLTPNESKFPKIHAKCEIRVYSESITNKKKFHSLKKQKT